MTNMPTKTEKPERPAPVAHLTLEERAAKGVVTRTRVPLVTHADWSPAEGRPNPVELLEEQAMTRVPELVPIRHGRMAASPFAFYRGAAYVMASDLAHLPRSGLEVQLCGDAHLVNFGGFASPERTLVFDINDFDETLPGPFEWDVKRLAASFEVAARSRSLAAKVRRGIVRRTVRSYRETLRAFAGMRNLEVWYSRLDADAIGRIWGQELGAKALKQFQRTVAKAESKDRLRAMAKLCQLVDGQPRLLSQPPLLVPAEELFRDADQALVQRAVREALRSYRRSLSGERRRLLESYRYIDFGRKVVGVGSVGTRTWVALLIGHDNEDPLFIQVKEAQASVLEPFLSKSVYGNHGQRVVEGQRLMQASSDIFLGWQRTVGPDGVEQDYYMRQLWDWKASPDVDTMAPEIMAVYGQICGWTLARAHARSGDRVAISAYLGDDDTFDRAIADFSRLYADQNELDHQALVSAIASDQVAAEAGV